VWGYCGVAGEEGEEFEKSAGGVVCNGVCFVKRSLGSSTRPSYLI
jgi:hypothetical protein